MNRKILSKFLEIWFVMFFVVNNIYSEKIISFNPTLCEFLYVQDGFPSIMNDSISYYTIRYVSDDIEYLVTKNSLSSNIFVPLGNQISIEIFDDEKVYCNVSKEFEFNEKNNALKEMEIRKIKEYIEKEKNKQNFLKYHEKFEIGYYLLVLILIIILSFIFSFLILLNRNRKLKRKYF